MRRPTRLYPLPLPNPPIKNLTEINALAYFVTQPVKKKKV
jgi:hypothetical protein